MRCFSIRELKLLKEKAYHVFAQVESYPEGEYVEIIRIAMPESLLPEQDTIKEIIQRAFFHLYEPSDEALAKYGIRLEYSDSEAEIRTV